MRSVLCRQGTGPAGGGSGGREALVKGRRVRAEGAATGGRMARMAGPDREEQAELRRSTGRGAPPRRCPAAAARAGSGRTRDASAGWGGRAGGAAGRRRKMREGAGGGKPPRAPSRASALRTAASMGALQLHPASQWSDVSSGIQAITCCSGRGRGRAARGAG